MYIHICMYAFTYSFTHISVYVGLVTVAETLLHCNNRGEIRWEENNNNSINIFKRGNH